MTEEIPKTIGAYKIEKEKYKLSNSNLYLGINTNINEKVLINIFQKEKIKSHVDHVSLMNNEIFILKLLNHKNILKLYEIIETPAYIFMIFEYFEGLKLSDYIIQKKQLSEDEVVIILKEVLEVLVYLHEMNLCHLNINSNNIIIDDQKHLKIYDFKYSHFYSSKQKDKVTFIGDAAFTCPELHSKKQYNAELADMWSCGVLLYNMLTGTLPFVPKKNQNIFRLIIRGEYGIPTSLPENMKNLIKSLLEVKEEKRYKIDDVLNSPAFKSKNITKESFSHGLNILITKYPIDNLALNICKNNYKIDVASIIKGLESNRFTQATSLFKQIVNKLYVKGFPNISDLNSEKFIAYVNDNNNYHTPEVQAANMQQYLKLEEDVTKNTKDLAAILFNNQSEISRKLDEIKQNFDMKKKGIKPKRTNNSVELQRSRRRRSFDYNEKDALRHTTKIPKDKLKKGKEGNKRRTVVLDSNNINFLKDKKEEKKHPGGRFVNVDKKIIEEEKEEEEIKDKNQQNKKEELKKEDIKKEEPKPEPKKEESKPEPKKEEPKPEPKKEEPKPEPIKVEPKKEEPKKPEPKKEEFKKPEPKKEEPKKPEQKKEEPKKPEPKKPEQHKPETKNEEPKKPESKKEQHQKPEPPKINPTSKPPIEDVKLTKVILPKREDKPKPIIVSNHKQDAKAINDKISSNAKKVKISEDVKKKEEESKINKLRGGLKKIEGSNNMTKSMGNINSKPSGEPAGGFKSIKEMIEFNIKKNANNSNAPGIRKNASNATGMRVGSASNKTKK